MKTATKNLFLVPALIAGLGLLPAGRVMALTFTNLHSFTGVSDGSGPQAGLAISGSTLYGTAGGGGSSGKGTVFAVNTDGTDFTNLHSFTATTSSTNSDGVNPFGGLASSGNILYGMANAGGGSGRGTVFAINTDGTGFTNLHSFTALSNSTNSDGSTPDAGLILSGNTLYGTAEQGGSAGAGTVFKLNTDGTSFTNLHSFTGGSGGASPQANLVLSGNTLYGTTVQGGSSGVGTVFAVNTDGTGFTNLHSFISASDGANPFAALILSGTTLYGTAYFGGSSGVGTVFAVNTDGTGFTNLHSFTGGSGGSFPRAGVILRGNTLYGTAQNGGTSGSGLVFAVNTDGTGFTNFYSFTQVDPISFTTNSDGALPFGVLLLSGNTLYGTADSGGTSGKGTVFSLTLATVSAPQLTITRSGDDVILTWGTNFTGFTLEANTNLGTTNWSVVIPSPVTSGTNNVVTNSISGPEKYYRLRSP